MNKQGIVHELHKTARKNVKERHVIQKYFDDLWQTDLFEMTAYSSAINGFQFLITVIDTFSKYS